VWTDAPSESPIFQLVNNLDLSVLEVSSLMNNYKVHLGNSDGTAEADSLNNVEQVTLNGLPMDRFTEIIVHVHGTNIPSKQQAFAVVVNGNFTQEKSCNNDLVCPKGCSGNGKCVLGKCVCDMLFFGADCSLSKYCNFSAIF
jgi:hypothetical protein